MLRPRSSPSSSWSTSVTRKPDWAKHIAMPPPMVPAPIMPTCLTGCASVPAAMPSIFPAARSAKNRCLSAADCGSSMQASNARRSAAKPSSKVSVPAASRQSRMRCGAVCPFKRLAMVSRAWESRAVSSSLIVRGMSRVSRLPAPWSISASANLVAPSPRSPAHTSSTTRAVSASCAVMGRPVVIMSIACANPASRGNRCVPPAPGSKPRLTSGNPTFADVVATR